MNSLNEASNPDFSPYGTGNTSRSPIIAISEAWGGYIGHFLTSRRYRFANTGAVRNDGVLVGNAGGLDAHERVLEEFNPNQGNDPFAWIPIGLLWDLTDGGIEPGISTIVDDVVPVDYTPEVIWNALDVDVQSVPAYETRLLQENGNAQQVDVNALEGV